MDADGLTDADGLREIDALGEPDCDPLGDALPLGETDALSCAAMLICIPSRARPATFIGVPLPSASAASWNV